MVELAQKIDHLHLPSLGMDSPISKDYSIPQAFQYCIHFTKQKLNTFPHSFVFVPPKIRPYMASVYAYYSIIKDFVNNSEFDGIEMARLKDWETCFYSDKNNPVMIALKETIKKFNIPSSLLTDLITARKMDVVVTRAPSFNHLLKYCRYSANPLGRIILFLTGYPAPRFFDYSDNLCTALQLTSILQNTSTDLEQNRILIPLAELNRFRYSVTDFKKRIYNENFKRLINFYAEHIEEYYHKAKPLCTKVPGRLSYSLKSLWIGGILLLKKIVQSEEKVFTHNIQLNNKDKLKILIATLNKNNFV